MGVNSIDFKRNLSQDTARQFSPAIWADCPIIDIKEGRQPGLLFEDDFNELPLAPTLTTQIAWGKYKAFATSGSSISRVSAVNSVELTGGALATSLAASADSATIAQAYPGFRMSGASADAGKLWFEACIAVDVITANAHGLFVGLAETELWTLATGVPFSSNTGSAITNSAAAIGFNLPSNGLGQMKTVVSDRATSFTSIGATDPTVMAPFVFTKVGFTYDPLQAGASNTRLNQCQIVFYQDNLQLATGYTNASLLATTNLKANALGPIFSTIGGSAVSTGLTFMKWWRVAQLLPA